MDTKQRQLCNIKILEAILILGSATKLADALGITSATVSNWKKNKALPSYMNAMKIEKLTEGQIKKTDLRPDFDF